ncbi:hypothetical protein [Anaerorhabdus sp.]|uniref:hypothetical protein n=1 Tax=Anaerorhabdus sp. TaxID=1872524 RepID=UPI002FC89276
MKKILIVVTVLLLFFGITQCINVFIINKSKENFANIPKIEGYESIYETTFDDKKVVFYQRNNDIYYTVDDQAFKINNLYAKDGITRFWWANADEPTGNLDKLNGDKVMDLMLNTTKKLNATVFLL